ncbi:hypothetical protein BKI52_38285 [marine bacterium AO1-C]|nr:hypothetical protein BKI52_38285 [marine bacterium AO1-C]
MSHHIDKLIQLFTSILPISQKEAAFMQQFSQVQSLQKRDNYSAYGSICKKMGFVSEGIFKVVRTNAQGQDFIPYFITEGHFAVDLESFTQQTFSEEDIIALTPCTVVTIEKKHFDLFENEVANFSKIIGHLKEKALLEKHRLKSEMLIDDAVTRYEKLRLRHPSIIQQVSQNHIAQYLGISPYTLSRIRTHS